MPEIADATYQELWSISTPGNYTNYARWYLGSTLSFAKSQAFEYQCTHAVGKEGAGHISNAIGLGVIKHPVLELAENPWYTSVPTVLPTTAQENDLVKSYTELTTKFSQKKKEANILVDQIASGYTEEGISNAEEAAAAVSETWNGKQYLSVKNDAWKRLQDYYNSLNG